MRANSILAILACVLTLSAAQYCVNNPGSCVRLRSSPTTTATVLTCMPHAASLKTDGQVRVADGMNWRRVSYNSAWGWAATHLLQLCRGNPTLPGGGSPTCNLGPGTYQTAYSNGQNIGNIEVVTILGKPVEKRTACAFMSMYNAARVDGYTLVINSGFRTWKEQEYFYNCSLTKSCNNGNGAFPPGYSNHQNGIALDISTGGGVYNWLANNAHKFGFVRTVPKEAWHWEYKPGSPRASYT